MIAAVQIMFWMFVFNAVTALLAITDFDQFAKSVQPKWSSSYSVEGDIISPMAEMHEPFNAWYDSESSKSRIDYHHGKTMTYQLANKESFDSSQKLIQFTTEKEQGNLKCIEANGTDEYHISPQPILPDLSNYMLVDQNQENGILVEKWINTIQLKETVIEYIMSLYRQDGIVYPLEFQMNAFHSVFQKMYDHYTIVYKHYIPVKPDPIIFNSEELKCEYVPLSSVNHDINPMMEFIDNYREYNRFDSTFEDFKKNSNKSYTIGTVEYFNRKNNFRQNLRYINSKNRAIVGYTLAINHLADYSDTELKSIINSKNVSYEHDYGVETFPNTNNYLQDVPSQVDWRYTGAVTPVKDQKTCHSCWSFGATGVIEGAYFLRHGVTKSFSEQALIDCSWVCGNLGCSKGKITYAYTFMMKYGVPTEQEYGPYLNRDGICHMANIPADRVTKIARYVNVRPYDEDALKNAVFFKGPISISVYGTLKSFSFYSHGIYYDKDCRNNALEGNHAMLLVGYGILNGYPYWLVKNSWSARWGEDGYILISTYENNCGVLTSPTYVILL